ncbi:MAG: hypothetical protein Ct9H300mP32_7090 [Verrucomicrobiota bacterium]|nr:MAG: hypothetical protein Ct9H300mP32_7090 [Verrucomicrobiota bacterium]
MDRPGVTAKGGDVTVKINGVVSTKLTNDKGRGKGTLACNSTAAKSCTSNTRTSNFAP